MKAKTFRQMPKENLSIDAPIRLAGIVRERAARERRSISSVATEALALGLGLDPVVYGIETSNQT